jgi:hypothetical protein
MSSGQAVLIVIVSLVIIASMTAVMIGVNQSERRIMQRRRQEWIARGSLPEEKPNFYVGRPSF